MELVVREMRELSEERPPGYGHDVEMVRKQFAKRDDPVRRQMWNGQARLGRDRSRGRNECEWVIRDGLPTHDPEELSNIGRKVLRVYCKHIARYVRMVQ